MSLAIADECYFVDGSRCAACNVLLHGRVWVVHTPVYSALGASLPDYSALGASLPGKLSIGSYCENACSIECGHAIETKRALERMEA